MLNIFIILSIIIILAVSFWSAYQINALERTISTGFNLIAETRSVHNLLKDLIFDMFMPQMYNLLKDLTYSPSTTSLLNAWIDQNDKYRTSLYRFLNSNELKPLLSDPELKEKYDAALSITGKTFDQIEELKKGFKNLQEKGLLGDEKLYFKLQSSEDYSMQQLFNQLRNANYYITFTFESYMNYFIKSLQAQSDRIQQSIIFIFLIVVAAVGGMIVLGSYMISRQMTKNLGVVRQSIQILSQGDFTSRLSVNSADEFDELLTNMNALVIRLKNNINSVLTLMHKVGMSINFDLKQMDLIGLVCHTILDETKIDGILFIRINEAGGSFTITKTYGDIPSSGRGNLKGDRKIKNSIIETVLAEKNPIIMDPSLSSNGKALPGIDFSRIKSAMVLPVLQEHEVTGVLILLTLGEHEPLNDLDHFKLQTFSEYAALLVDNYTKYAELLKKKEAEYMALQFQVQPHFLYNILNNLIGLNRKGDTKRLEETVFALKDMMRYTTQRDAWTTVSREFEFLQQYLRVQKTRFGEKLSFKIECEDTTRDYKIPKLLLQPIVENAVIHGIEPLKAGGMVSVSSKHVDMQQKEFLEIIITDNGPGFVYDRLPSGNGIGLRNVRERIEHVFPKAILSIEGDNGTGTAFSLKIRIKDLQK